MNTIYFDSLMGDQERRRHLYEGQLLVFSPRSSTLAFCQFARQLIHEAFGDLAPKAAQYHLPIEEYTAILSKLKPRFINHPQSKQCIQAVLKDFECAPAETYFDVPRLRTSTSNGYLTTGIAYAWHPHRDTWYSAPQCQINWWIPIYEIDANDGLAFHLRYWKEPIRNDSSVFNYYRWNREFRGQAAKHLKEDPRPLPRPTDDIDMDSQLRPVCRPGGVIMFSGAQLHSTVPNTSGATRFSIDFRTIHTGDLVDRKGAPNIDSACTGTSLRDFLRASDLSRLPDSIVAPYTDGTEALGDLTYSPSQ